MLDAFSDKHKNFSLYRPIHFITSSCPKVNMNMYLIKFKIRDTNRSFGKHQINIKQYQDSWLKQPSLVSMCKFMIKILINIKILFQSLFNSTRNPGLDQKWSTLDQIWSTMDQKWSNPKSQVGPDLVHPGPLLVQPENT